MRQIAIVVFSLLILSGCYKKNLNSVVGTWTKVSSNDKWVDFSWTEGGNCDGGEYSFHLYHYSVIEKITFDKDGSTCNIELKGIKESLPQDFCETEELSIRDSFWTTDGYFDIGNTYLHLALEYNTPENGTDYFHEIENGQLVLTDINSGAKSYYEK